MTSLDLESSLFDWCLIESSSSCIWTQEGALQLIVWFLWFILHRNIIEFHITLGLQNGLTVRWGSSVLRGPCLNTYWGSLESSKQFVLIRLFGSCWVRNFRNELFFLFCCVILVLGSNYRWQAGLVMCLGSWKSCVFIRLFCCCCVRNFRSLLFFILLLWFVGCLEQL